MKGVNNCPALSIPCRRLGKTRNSYMQIVFMLVFPNIRPCHTVSTRDRPKTSRKGVKSYEC